MLVVIISVVVNMMVSMHVSISVCIGASTLDLGDVLICATLMLTAGLALE